MPPSPQASSVSPSQTLNDAVLSMNEYEISRLAALIDGLLELSDAELREMDALITPRAAQLLGKAFGPALAVALAPLTNDTEQQDPANSDSTPPDRAPSPQQSDLRSLMASPGYWRDRNPDLIAQVARLVQQRQQHPTDKFDGKNRLR